MPENKNQPNQPNKLNLPKPVKQPKPNRIYLISIKGAPPEVNREMRREQMREIREAMKEDR